MGYDPDVARQLIEDELSGRDKYSQSVQALQSRPYPGIEIADYRGPPSIPQSIVPAHITGDPSGGGLAAFAQAAEDKFGTEAGLLGHGIGGGGYDDAADYGVDMDQDSTSGEGWE